MADVRDSITALYISYFDRAADAAGLAYWEQNAADNGDTAALFGISAAFAENSVAKVNYPSTMSDAEYVDRMFVYSLNTAPDQAGNNYWVSRIEASSRSEVMVEFVNAVLDYEDDPTNPDNDSGLLRQAILQNKVQAAQYFSDTLGSKSNVPLDDNNEPDVDSDNYQASIDVLADIDQTLDSVIDSKNKTDGYEDTLQAPYTLTKLQDNIVGSGADETIIGLVGGTDATLTSGDQINGNNGDDTLSLTAKGLVDLGVATITNVENVIVSDVNGVNVDMAASAGLSFDTLTINNNGGDIYDIASGTDVTLNNTSGEVFVDYNTDTTTTNVTVASTVNGASNDVFIYYGVFVSGGVPVAGSGLAAARTLNSTVNVIDSTYVEVYYNLTNEEHDNTGVDITNSLTVDGVDENSVFVEYYHDGDATVTQTLIFSNSDDTYVDIDADDGSTNTVATNNTVNIILDTVTVSEIDVEEFKTINITVDGDSTLDYINSNFNTIDVAQTFNITANADLTIDNLTINDVEIVGEENQINITGAGNVSFDLNDDNYDTTIDGSTATGDLTLGAFSSTRMTLGFGDDTVRYVSATDSQLIFTGTDAMSGFDVITGFGLNGTDLIELLDSLGLATGDARSYMLQKGAIGGTSAADMQAFIGNGIGFFDNGDVDLATAFADDGVNGYLYVDANSDGNFTEADDMVIQTLGVTTMDITDIQFG